MGKPVVFLSHSSWDKAKLIALKEFLDKRAVGSLEFFLSSDGQSIRLGQNWVVRIVDALAQAKLMFLFLSPESATSTWIHFEAGGAYAKGIEVVPVCLPGLELRQINPPLRLLQGFNLHSHEAMSNIIRLCNETFSLKMDEAFSPEEFNSIFAGPGQQTKQFFRDHGLLVEKVVVESQYLVASSDISDPSREYVELCRGAGLEVRIRSEDNYTGMDSYGCYLSIRRREIEPDNEVPSSAERQTRVELECTLSPELFHLYAPLLDRWLPQTSFPRPWKVRVDFRQPIRYREPWHRLTPRLYGSGIRLGDAGGFDFKGFVFELTHHAGFFHLEFACDGKLDDQRLSEAVEKLWQTGVLFDESKPGEIAR